jgi:methionine-gamma-lyase
LKDTAFCVILFLEIHTPHEPKEQTMKFNTKVIHEGQGVDPVTLAHVSPIYQTSTYILPDYAAAVEANKPGDPGFHYSRTKHPSEYELSCKLAALELTEAAVSCASGLGAISLASMNLLSSGDHFIFGDVVYGCTHTLFTKVLPKFGVEHTIVDMKDPEAVRQALRPNTKMVYIETPSNPTLKCVDIRAIADIAHSQEGITVVTDNTFATPFNTNPAELGSDVVVHSLTKYLCGHGTVVAGVVCGTKEFVQSCRAPYLQTLGSTIDPFAAWLVMQGLKTFAVRMERHCENAMKVAEFLEGHPKVERVYYPGLASHPSHEIAKKQMRSFGAMMSADIKGGMEGAATLMDNVRIFGLATSLGTVDSLIQHSPVMSHAGMTPEARHAVEIYDNQVRISVGLEDVEDLIEDLDQALSLIRHA